MKKQIILISFALLVIITACSAVAAAETTERVSIDSGGVQATGDSFNPSVSADGRYVAFGSLASNLVAGDSNGARDVFVRDCVSGVTSRVSVATDGTQANGDSDAPSVSADGRYIAFSSYASDLVAGDSNGATDVFVRDRVTGETTRVSVATGGTQANDRSESPSVSADGRYVAFGSLASNLVAGDSNGAWDVFVHDRVTGETTRVSVANGGVQATGDSFNPSISADGRYVAFNSFASDLVAGDTNSASDVFVHDRGQVSSPVVISPVHATYTYKVKVPYKKGWYKSWHKKWYKKWYKVNGNWKYKWKYKWRYKWKYGWLYHTVTRTGIT